jgi:hypothetical protein
MRENLEQTWQQSVILWAHLHHHHHHHHRHIVIVIVIVIVICEPTTHIDWKR